MPPLGFEPKISVMERAKTIHASYREATEVGIVATLQAKKSTDICICLTLDFVHKLCL
jgi:hypothetical protein